MTKIFSILFLGLLFLNTQLTFAAETAENKAKNIQEYSEEDFDFTSKSNYITDEQLQAAQEIDEIEEKSTFGTKIINSSHFSSSTATKTYIPINKVGK